MPTIFFKNEGGKTINVAVNVGGASTSSFRLNPGQVDNGTQALAGQVVSFWWRDDGNQCITCDNLPDCKCHTFAAEDGDTLVALAGPNGHYEKQTM